MQCLWLGLHFKNGSPETHDQTSRNQVDIRRFFVPPVTMTPSVIVPDTCEYKFSSRQLWLGGLAFVTRWPHSRHFLFLFSLATSWDAIIFPIKNFQLWTRPFLCSAQIANATPSTVPFSLSPYPLYATPADRHQDATNDSACAASSCMRCGNSFKDNSDFNAQ